MRQFSKISAAVFLAIGLAVLTFLWFYKAPAPQNQDQALKRAIELQKWGRYDAAAKVIQSWMQDVRRDVSNDDFLYQQIAMIYIAKAYRRLGSRDESVRAADANLQKALEVYDKQEPKAHDVELFGIGGGYELLGDLSASNKCKFYYNAKETFVRQLPLLQGDSFIEYGHTFDLKRARAEVQRHLDSVVDKSSKAGCGGSKP
jgi:tetratricopeptide (TPR) repeat protein